MSFRLVTKEVEKIRRKSVVDPREVLVVCVLRHTANERGQCFTQRLFRQMDAIVSMMKLATIKLDARYAFAKMLSTPPTVVGNGGTIAVYVDVSVSNGPNLTVRDNGSDACSC